MKKALEQVREFHEAFGLPILSYPMFPTEDRRELRARLEAEELEELFHADKKHNLVEIADAAADLIYVILGRCLEYGIPIDLVFDEVHRSNMSKLGEDGKPIHRSDGKVVKGPNFSKPEILPI